MAKSTNMLDMFIVVYTTCHPDLNEYDSPGLVWLKIQEPLTQCADFVDISAKVLNIVRRHGLELVGEATFWMPNACAHSTVQCST